MNSSGSRSAREALALNLIRLRRARGWTQEALAHACELHRSYVGDIERRARNVSVDTVERLAAALEVEPWVLLQPQCHRSTDLRLTLQRAQNGFAQLVFDENGFGLASASQPERANGVHKKNSARGGTRSPARVSSTVKRAPNAPGLRGKI